MAFEKVDGRLGPEDGVLYVLAFTKTGSDGGLPCSSAGFEYVLFLISKSGVPRQNALENCTPSVFAITVVNQTLRKYRVLCATRDVLEAHGGCGSKGLW